jgi:hypothetical protein
VKLNLADLEVFLGAPAEDTAVNPYVDAAAVLAAFDPLSLRPLGATDGEGPAPMDRLLPLCEPITEGAGQGLWSLTLAARRAGLRRLGTRERMTEALGANPQRIHTSEQRVFERVVAGGQIVLDEQPREELAALIAVGEWLRGLLDRVPDDASVRRAIARHDLIAPMRRLVASGFVDRQDPLARLLAYTSGPPSPAPLFVHGSGGVGKSTMLARFLLDEHERGGTFAYIDIDRPTIAPEKPLTLLADAVAQLALQFELPQAVGLTEQIAESLGREEDRRQFESIRPADDWLLDQFRDLLWNMGEHNLIIVVDTFEEAQFLGPDVVVPCVDFLNRLAASAPAIRVIISGRTLPDEYAASDLVPPIDLGVLDEDSARELLTKGIEQAGLPKLSPTDLDDVIRVVSRNPMCLKLAVRLLRDEGPDRLRSMRSEVLSRLKAEKVQALLYGRVLHHIHTEDVKKVAYPGLIVRRITADVIREVLAKPCELELTPERNEYAIYWDLQREAALVEQDPEDGSLRHRTDVRRAMLEDLTDHVDQEVVAAIDTAAVAFYEQQEGPIARAEEIYHRLRRRDPDAILEERWLRESGTRLKGAGDELRAQQRLWLAEKLGATLDASVREAASQEAWEAQAARSADRYLTSRLPEAALEVLHEREQRLPRSELFALEAEAYRFLGRSDEALRVARVGVGSMTRDGAIDMALDLLLKMVLIEEGRDNHIRAGELIAEAGAVASHSTNEILRLRTEITDLRVERTDPRALHSALPGRIAAALELLTPELRRELRSRSVLLREIAAELGGDDAGIAAAAFETLGIELTTDEQAERLGRALGRLVHEDVGKSLSLELRRAAEAFEASGFDPVIIREWSTKRTSPGDTREIGRVLARCPAPSQVLREFREYFRAGVEYSLRPLTAPP